VNDTKLTCSASIHGVSTTIQMRQVMGWGGANWPASNNKDRCRVVDRVGLVVKRRDGVMGGGVFQPQS